MKSRLALTIAILILAGAGSLWALQAGERVVKPDMTPLKDSPEVQRLITGTLTVDPDEPAAAVRAYIETQKSLMRIPRDPTEAQEAYDADTPLNEAIAAMQEATRLYPTSRTAWIGLGHFLRDRYVRRHRVQDLREAVQAYMRAIALIVAKGSDSDRRDLVNLVEQVTQGLIVLKDRSLLDAFVQTLEATRLSGFALWPEARVLAALNDPNADQLYQQLLAGTKPRLPNGIWESYIEYLFTRSRYKEVLDFLGQIPPSDITGAVYVRWFHLVKGATLERLGRLEEAKAAYRRYMDEVANEKQVWPYVFPANEKFRIPGSTLQRGIEFSREPYGLPEPESTLP